MSAAGRPRAPRPASARLRRGRRSPVRARSASRSPVAGRWRQMVCSRSGLYSAEHRYITVELSCSARKPCARPSEMYTDLRSWSSSTIASQRPKVGEPTRMSTTTSNTEPGRQVTNLAWLGGSCGEMQSAQHAGRRHRAVGLLQVEPVPREAGECPRSVNHSKNSPRIGMQLWLISHAPAMSSSRTPSLAPIRVARFDGVLERAPPRFVVPVPVDGRTQALCEIRMLWLPT